MKKPYLLTFNNNGAAYIGPFDTEALAMDHGRNSGLNWYVVNLTPAEAKAPLPITKVAP